MTSTNHNPSAVTGDGKIAVTGAAENTDGNGLAQSGDPTTTIGAATIPGATANLPASSAPAKGPALVVGQILSGKINKVLEYGALVDLDNGPTTLMNTEAMSGGTFDNRKARRDTLKRGDEVAVEVLRIRPPKPGTKQWRINVSERVLQERAIREQLHGGTDTEPGSIVVGKVKELKDYGVLIEATEGPAIGYSCLLHAVEVSLGDRDERDNFLEALEVGQM